MVRKFKLGGSFKLEGPPSAKETAEKLIRFGYGPGGKNLKETYEERFGRPQDGEDEVNLLGPKGEQTLKVPKSKLPEVLELISNHPSKKNDNIFFRSPTNDFREESIDPNLYSDNIADSDLIFVCDLQPTENEERPAMTVRGLHVFWVPNEGKKRSSNVVFTAIIDDALSLFDYAEKFFSTFRTCLIRSSKSFEYEKATTIYEIDELIFQTYQGMWDLDITLIQTAKVPKNIANEFKAVYTRKFGTYRPHTSRASEWVLRVGDYVR
jgi:hypothetical protein